MPPVSRVLDPEPVPTLADHLDRGGGRGLAAARQAGGDAVLSALEASGLRGRGGAGFPTALKWKAVVENRAAVLPPTVVANAAEGEPGSFKDRMLVRTNPYRVLEGLLIAAQTVGARDVVVATKASFHQEIARLRRALEELAGAGWTDGLSVSIVEGPSEYLYGEETALLEVIAGRAPFPRISPPFRMGVPEVGTEPGTSAGTAMATEDEAGGGPPVLVNNVETLANVAGIVAEGPDWFRRHGTERSPGTIVCTVSGRVQRHGVAEFPLGTPLAEIIDTIGGGPLEGRAIVAAMSGVANALVPAARLGTPATYEDLRDIGSGLGAAGFIVFDDATDLAAVAAGVSRFLAVESCGQCTPCKQDGLALAELTARLRRSEAEPRDLDAMADLLSTVADESRCFLATQHQQVLTSVVDLFADALLAHTVDAAPAGEEPIAAIADLVEGRVVLDDEQRRKQPDWSFEETYSGQSPADRVDQRLATAGRPDAGAPSGAGAGGEDGGRRSDGGEAAGAPEAGGARG